MIRRAVSQQNTPIRQPAFTSYVAALRQPAYVAQRYFRSQPQPQLLHVPAAVAVEVRTATKKMPASEATSAASCRCSWLHERQRTPAPGHGLFLFRRDEAEASRHYAGRSQPPASMPPGRSRQIYGWPVSRRAIEQVADSCSARPAAPPAPEVSRRFSSASISHFRPATAGEYVVTLSLTDLRHAFRLANAARLQASKEIAGTGRCHFQPIAAQ